MGYLWDMYYLSVKHLHVWLLFGTLLVRRKPVYTIPPTNFIAMARLQGDFSVTGTLGFFSAYRMKGVEGVVMRAKGGPSANQIKHSPRFRKTRNNMIEFSTCAVAGSKARLALTGLHGIVDYNITPALNALCKKIQLLDTVNPHGERQVLFSQHPYLLEGCNLNRRNGFDSVLHSPLRYTANTRNCSATVSVPSLLPGVNLQLPGDFAFYRLVFTIAILPDAPTRESLIYHASAETAWTASHAAVPAREYTLQFQQRRLLPAGESLVLGAGIELSADGMQAVKYAGAGKVLGVVTG